MHSRKAYTFVPAFDDTRHRDASPVCWEGHRLMLIRDKQKCYEEQRKGNKDISRMSSLK